MTECDVVVRGVFCGSGDDVLCVFCFAACHLSWWLLLSLIFVMMSACLVSMGGGAGVALAVQSSVSYDRDRVG